MIHGKNFSEWFICEHFGVSKSKFELVVFQLLKYLYLKWIYLIIYSLKIILQRYKI